MNCNTTHYRANSSSVPGDPTADRCNYSNEHSQQIARLSLWLFDATRGVHGLTDTEREWLEYAALLHDVGVHISYEGHHKHSQYLICNGDLRGFEPLEVEIMSLIARYHRRAAPKRSHADYGALGRRHRQIVRTLAAILRLSESLDRSHAQIVTGVALEDRGDDYRLQIKSPEDIELEVWAAARHAEPFERMLGKPLQVEGVKDRSVAAPPRPRHEDDAATGVAASTRGRSSARQQIALLRPAMKRQV